MLMLWKVELYLVYKQQKQNFSAAREAGDIKSEVEAQKEIARLGVEEARVNA